MKSLKEGEYIPCQINMLYAYSEEDKSFFIVNPINSFHYFFGGYLRCQVTYGWSDE